MIDQQNPHVLPFTDQERTYWKAEVDRARRVRKTVEAEYGWDDNLKRYKPSAPRDGEINTGVDFADVERKKAALLFDTPTVSLSTLVAEKQAIVAIHQQLLNTLLGPQHADVQPTALQAIFNCLCPSGVGPVVVGFSSTSVPVKKQLPVPGPDGQPMIDPLTLQPVLVEQEVPISISDKFYVAELSPKSLLLPADLRTTQYEKAAPWIGYEWVKPASQLKREYNLPADWVPKQGESEKPYFHAEQDQEADSAANDPKVSGVTIWYHAYLDAQPGEVKHPDALRELVWVDGDEQPLIRRDSPHQDLDAEGRLTLHSLIGNPIDPLVLRDLTDSAWIPSDCAMTGQLTKEQQKYRRIALEKRENNKDVILYDAGAFSPEVRDKIERGSIGTRIPVEPGALAGGVQGVMAQVLSANQGRESYLDQELIASDRAKILAIDYNQAGANTPTKRTATESSIVQRNTDARFEQERQRVLKWFLGIVRKFDALVVRYCDERLATEILGPQKGQAWFQAKQQGALAGQYAYALQMDSGKYLDVESDRRQFLQVINFAAKSQFINQMTMWREFCEKFGYDPTEWIVQPEPPKPEPAKLSLSIALSDLAGPAGAIGLEILQQYGINITPGAVSNMFAATRIMQQRQLAQEAATNPTHPGAADKAPRIDQHMQDESGAMPGPGPM